MAISYCYWHLVVKNGNITLLLTPSSQEWQFHIATDIQWSKMAIGRFTPRSAGRSTPQVHHEIYIMGCIWQPFWILLEKVGISFYFWMIRLVNSQLALYSHVRCNPPWCPNTPKAPPKHCHTTITNFNYEGSYLPGVICNIVVKADLGRWTPWGIEKRCLEYWYTKIGRWTYFGWWTPQVNQA